MISIFPNDIVINILGFIKQNGPMILSYDFKQNKFIDTEHPDYTRDKILVQENGWYFEYIRLDFKTEEMCKLAVQQPKNYSIANLTFSDNWGTGKIEQKIGRAIRKNVMNK